MIKQAPSPGRIALMVAFTLSCFGILLFLWLSFGGSVPLRPEGYRVNVPFDEATQLAQEAEVRISGVKVGTVKKKEPNERTGVTDAVLEIDERFAPIPADTRAILRQKTLLGETYVELTPGSRRGPKVRDGGRLPRMQIASTVELDEIFRTFDPKTRQAFSTWLSEAGTAVGNRGRELNAALANLDPFAENVDEVLRVLDEQEGATRGLVRDTGEVFAALTERQGQLRDLIRNSNRVFQTTAARNRELAETFVVFPTFLSETRRTTRRVTRFARTTDPLVTQLRPAARALSPTLVDLKAIAPDLRGFFRDLGPLIRVSRRGVPATEKLLDETEPLLERLDPWLRDLNPILSYLGLYRRELTAFLGNIAAATQAVETAGGRSLHYLRSINPINPEVLSAYPNRLAGNRANPYVEPGGYSKLARGLEVFGSYLCTNNQPPTLSPGIPEQERTPAQEFALTNNPTNAPPCREQRALGQIIGQPGRFPQLQRNP